jgi:hypothetical protein
MPCLFSVKSIASQDVEVQVTTEKGKIQSFAVITDKNLPSSNAESKLELCYVMCCDSEKFLELCELHSRSAKLIEKDAEARHAKLLEFRQSGKH